MAKSDRVTHGYLEKRCKACEPPPGIAKVVALSVSDSARCDACGLTIGSGQNFWVAVLSRSDP